MSGGDFEATLKDYVTSVERFVQSMHDGLSEITALSATNSARGEAPPPERRTSAPPLIRFAETKKILVVEPTEIHRVLFGRYFQGLPLEIQFARTEEESQQLQSDCKFDLVLTDWNTRLRQGLPKSELVSQVLARLES